jgi:hypothetical protein
MSGVSTRRPETARGAAGAWDTRLPSMGPLAVGVLAFALALPPSASAQVVLDTPDDRFPEDFGSIQTVRELPDGRVLVADPLGRGLYAVDMDRGTRTVVGRQGQGPDEYMQPDAVWPLPGDSTLLVDLGNGRLVALGPDLSFGPTMPIALGDPRPGAGAPFTLALPQGIDGRGRIYARALGMGGGPGGALPDSGAVLRIERSTRVADTAAIVKLQDRVRRESGGANERNVAIEAVPLSPEDAWGVAPDGSVVVARSGAARVDWIMPDGAVTRGRPISHEAVRIGTPEKEEWLLEQGRSGGGVGVAVSVENGAVSTRLSRGMTMGGGGQREIDQYSWPERMAPFRSGRVLVDPLGRAWVGRSAEAGEPSTYDVFDRSGERVRTVLLSPGARAVGFGREHVYVVTFDDFDLAYLERHPLPR